MPTSKFNLPPYQKSGYCVIPDVLNNEEVSLLRSLTEQLIRRHRSRDARVLNASISIADSVRQHPERNPGITPPHVDNEPFIIGELPTLQPRFASLLGLSKIWNAAAELLETPAENILFHFANITRKPAFHGPAVSQHRDADNTYFASSDRRTIRLLLPLQPMHAGNGGIQIMAGSHRSSHASEWNMECPRVNPGSCLALHSESLHESGPNRSRDDRDVLVVQFGLAESRLSHRAASETLGAKPRSEIIAFSSAIASMPRSHGLQT